MCVQRTKNSSIANCSKVKCLLEGVKVYEPSETVVDVKAFHSKMLRKKNWLLSVSRSLSAT